MIEKPELSAAVDLRTSIGTARPLADYHIVIPVGDKRIEILINVLDEAMNPANGSYDVGEERERSPNTVSGSSSPIF